MSRIYGVFVAVAVAEGLAVGLPGVFVRVAVAGMVRVAVADGVVGVRVGDAVPVAVAVCVVDAVGAGVVGLTDARAVGVVVATSGVGVGEGESPPRWERPTAKAIPPPITSAPPMRTATNGPVPGPRLRGDTRAVS